MPFVPNTGSGATTVASNQISQQFDAEATLAGATGTTTVILMRGTSKLRLIALQSVGAIAGSIQVQTAIANELVADATPPSLSWFNVEPPVITPLNTTMNVEFIVPGKFVRLQIVAPAANATTHEIAVMLSQ